MMRIHLLVGIILSLYASYISPTSINGRFTIIEDNFPKFTVLLQISTDTGIDDLGGATITFSFDTTALSFPNNPVKDVDYIYHNFSGGNYSSASITRPMKNRIWINLDLPFINSNNGTTVAAYPYWTDVVTIKFNRINPNTPPGLSWLINSLFWGIYDADNLTLWENGRFEGNFGLSVQIANSWNLVSVPGINPDGQGVQNWWEGRDPSSNVYKFINGIYTSINTTSPGEGYWMKHNGNNLYNTGDEWPEEGIQAIAHNPLTANEGWNLIGGYENPVFDSDLTTTPPGLITGLIYTYNNNYQISNVLEPGRGYFIKLSADGQINIPGGTTNGSGGVDEIFRDDWGKLTFTDSSGNSYSLYLADSETDLNLYELPPVPMADIFDIRFESGRIVENLNNGSQTILMNGLAYPVTINVENISLNLSAVLGKRMSGNLEPGKEFIIADKSVKKLAVSSSDFTTPIDFALEQNYPNPFNPITKINYSIPISSQVTLRIYDVLGNIVTTLVDEYLQPGGYFVEWNAEGFASGVYFYSIQSGDFFQTKKMILLK